MHYLAINVLGDNELYSIMPNTNHNNAYLSTNRITNEHGYTYMYTHQKHLTRDNNKRKLKT